MQPRLPSSKKWTAFPAEFCDQIKTVFSEAFKEQTKNGKIIVEGRIYQEEILFRVGYLEKGRLTQANFEASMNYDTKTMNAQDRISDCVDATASMMEQYFEFLKTASDEDELDFPYQWTEYPFEKLKIYLQFSTENSDLEAAANELLGLSAETLVDDSLEDGEDALDHSVEEKLKGDKIKH